MKKLFIISMMALMAFNATAQQGAFYASLSNINFFGKEDQGVSTGVSIVSKGDDKTTSYGLAPEIGYYVSDRVAVGGILGFSGKTDKKANSENKSFNFGFSPYVRYFLHQSDNFGFYLQGGFDFLQAKDEDTLTGGTTTTKTTTTTWGVSILPGVSYALSSNFSVLASFGTLGYSSEKVKDAKDAENTFGLNLDASTLRFSLRYTF